MDSYEALKQKRSESFYYKLLTLCFVIAVFFGWKLFWFLTDDAFIAFRYVSSSMLGYGYVWNPPPFTPVEGYTSFLWVLLLDITWRVLGVSPPISANWLSLFFGYLTLYVGYLIFHQMQISRAHRNFRVLFWGLILFGTITNRTFLTWLSSGLETSFFNFWITFWIYSLLKSSKKFCGSTIFQLCLCAALSTLTRPDGILIFAATITYLTLSLFWFKHRVSLKVVIIGILPLLLFPLHLFWRKSVYGEWLPNTYYAKVTGIWIESGWRYLLSFIIENGLWFWCLLSLTLFAKNLKNVFSFKKFTQEKLGITFVCLTIFCHILYYSVFVGGDHFEYRVFSYLIFLSFLSFIWIACHLTQQSKLIIFLIVVFIILSYPIPWIHWAKTKNLNTRQETWKLICPISQYFPTPLRPIISKWDELQSWLIPHHVGMRHQEHKIFYEYQTQIFPDRPKGSNIQWEKRAIGVFRTVGVPSWTMPHIAIIDGHGLNDKVIAKTAPYNTKYRLMAHERLAPPGYTKCFRPNVYIRNKKLFIKKRVVPLSDKEIRACENYRHTS